MAVAITYAGMERPRALRYTLTTGVLPDIAFVEMVRQDTTIAANGDLSWTDGTTTVTLPDCRVNRSSLRVSSNGQVMHVELWDRRYWWQFKYIIGRYNYTKPDGSIDSAGQKNMQQLATMCLDEAGESGYDVSALPATEYPYVNWDGDRPMDELQKLCQRYGYEIVWSPYTDTVTIVENNTGADLPNNTDVRSFSFGVTAGDRPSSIVLMGGKVSVQSKLKLRAVAPDLDGTIKRIDDLSYVPSSGWTWIQGSDFEDVLAEFGSEAHRLAKMAVFRWYQVESQADGTQDVPGYGAVNGIDDILPIDPHLNATYNDLDGKQKYQPAFIQGIWLPGAGEGNATSNTDIEEYYESGFSIVKEIGLVKFSGTQPVVMLDGFGACKEAELYLTCSYNVRSSTHHQPLRYGRTLALGGAPSLSGPMLIRHPEIVQMFTGVYSGTVLTSTTNNTTDVNTMADAILAQTALGLGDNTGYIVSYRFVKQITPNGKICQVGWSIRMRTGSQPGGCETVAAQQTEFDPHILSRGDRRRLIRGRYRDRFVSGPEEDRRWFFGKEA
jgi:hypothetical protein